MRRLLRLSRMYMLSRIYTHERARVVNTYYLISCCPACACPYYIDVSVLQSLWIMIGLFTTLTKPPDPIHNTRDHGIHSLQYPYNKPDEMGAFGAYSGASQGRQVVLHFWYHKTGQSSRWWSSRVTRSNSVANKAVNNLLVVVDKCTFYYCSKNPRFA